jgi:hypothetical protein
MSKTVGVNIVRWSNACSVVTSCRHLRRTCKIHVNNGQNIDPLVVFFSGCSIWTMKDERETSERTFLADMIPPECADEFPPAPCRFSVTIAPDAFAKSIARAVVGFFNFPPMAARPTFTAPQSCPVGMFVPVGILADVN